MLSLFICLIRRNLKVDGKQYSTQFEKKLWVRLSGILIWLSTNRSIYYCPSALLLNAPFIIVHLPCGSKTPKKIIWLWCFISFSYFCLFDVFVLIETKFVKEASYLSSLYRQNLFSKMMKRVLMTRKMTPKASQPSACWAVERKKMRKIKKWSWSDASSTLTYFFYYSRFMVHMCFSARLSFQTFLGPVAGFWS